MRTKHLVLWVLLLSFTQVSAQAIKVISNEPLDLPASELGFTPVISPTGDYILLSGFDNTGLRKYDFATKKLTTITTDRGAGFDLKISEDGKLVAYRSQQYINRLRYTTLKVLDIETQQTHEIIKNSRDIEGYSFQGGTILAVNDSKLVSKNIKGEKPVKLMPVSSLKQGQLNVTNKNITKDIYPSKEESNYLWTSVSPNGTKLLYYDMDSDLAFVSNIDGSNPVSLGVVRAAKWMGNDWVIGMEDYDNGVVLTSSSIVMVSAQGKHRTVLTDKSVIATDPSGTSDASTVVYSTDSGKIFVMKLAINK